MVTNDSEVTRESYLISTKAAEKRVKKDSKYSALTILFDLIGGSAVIASILQRQRQNLPLSAKELALIAIFNEVLSDLQKGKRLEIPQKDEIPRRVIKALRIILEWTEAPQTLRSSESEI